MNKNRYLMTFLAVIGLLALPSLDVAVKAQSPVAPDPTPLNQAALSVDGVDLSLSTPSLPASFIEPEPDNAAQVATAVAWDNFQEVSITAAPFGVKPPTENLPAAQPGMEAAYREALLHYRESQGGSPAPGPVATFFGKPITSSMSIVYLNVDGPAIRPVVITEWVVEAGPRIWIVRVSQRVDKRTSKNDVASSVQPLSEMNLASSDVFHPSTSVAASHKRGLMPQNSSLPQRILTPADDLPIPAWWNGDCDTNNYYAQSGGIAAYPLGGSYRGVKACGPRPYYGEGPDVLVRFFPGAWGEYEWECIELSMRYLYLAYGIAPYAANGSGVVWNYSGSRLQKISNGATGQAPQPGDVLSYGSTSSFGHTSVVAASSVDGSGNGSITFIEQNASATGSGTHAVSNWQVQSSASVSGWLHDPDTTAPAIAVTQQPATGQWYNTDQTIAFTISDVGSGVRGYTLAWDQNPPGGSEIASTSGSVNLSSTGQGQHTLYIQAWDNAGNPSAVVPVGWLGYDTVVPSNPTSTSPSCTATSGIWQNTCADANFTWNGASDATSGVAGYEVYWGTDPNGTGTLWSTTAAYDPAAVGSGTYYLRVRTKDNAGNWSAWATLFVLSYDGTAPANPTAVAPGCTATSGAWQNTCADANFTWNGASDATSGVAGYEVYWGTDPNGAGALWSTAAAYNPPAAGNGTDYLRVRTKDNAGNWSAWTTLFVLRYDGTAPTGSLQINSNASTTHATLVKVQTAVSDAHSGLCQMRLRDAGGTWTDWQGYTASAYWQLPGPTGQTFSVETQFKDCAGNSSATYTDTIALNIYPARPVSANYRMAKSTLGTSGQSGASTNYRLNATLGQPSMIGQMGSANYGLASGYWAMRYIHYAVCLPLIMR